MTAIKWALQKLKARFPSVRTITRILKREGHVKKTAYATKGVAYPYFAEALKVNNVHQVDLVSLSVQ